MGLDCDLDCAMTREFRKKRKLGVLDWARRLFSPSTTRPATTSPAVIRRRAQDAALDVLARPSPKTKRRLDVSPSKTKRAPFASLRHRRQGPPYPPDRGLPDENGLLHRAPLGGGPVRGHGRVGARDGRRGRLLDDVPGDRFYKCGLRRRARVLGRGELARGAASCDNCRGRAFCGAGHRADAGAVGEAYFYTKTDARRVRAMFGTGVLVRRDARGVHR